MKLQATCETNAHLLIQILREHYVGQLNYSANKVHASYSVELPQSNSLITQIPWLFQVSRKVVTRTVTYPEDVVDEETSEQDAARADSVQLKKLDTIQSKRQTKQIVGNPVLKGQTKTSNSPHTTK